MKAGQIGGAVAAVGGLAIVLMTFLNTATPYVTVAEAQEQEGRRVSVPGDLDKSSIQQGSGILRFVITDEKGADLLVVHEGAPPGNMGEATKVVAMGTYKDGALHADKLILKCPSKYEATSN